MHLPSMSTTSAHMSLSFKITTGFSLNNPRCSQLRFQPFHLGIRRPRGRPFLEGGFDYLLHIMHLLGLHVRCDDVLHVQRSRRSSCCRRSTSTNRRSISHSNLFLQVLLQQGMRQVANTAGTLVNSSHRQLNESALTCCATNSSRHYAHLHVLTQRCQRLYPSRTRFIHVVAPTAPRFTLNAQRQQTISTHCAIDQGRVEWTVAHFLEESIIFSPQPGNLGRCTRDSSFCDRAEQCCHALLQRFSFLCMRAACCSEWKSMDDLSMNEVCAHL